jgi:hypothetical protein
MEEVARRFVDGNMADFRELWLHPDQSHIYGNHEQDGASTIPCLASPKHVLVAKISACAGDLLGEDKESRLAGEGGKKRHPQIYSRHTKYGLTREHLP